MTGDVIEKRGVGTRDEQLIFRNDVYNATVTFAKGTFPMGCVLRIDIGGVACASVMISEEERRELFSFLLR